MTEPDHDKPDVATDNDDGRDALRASVHIDARVRDRQGARFTITVLDLSQSGFRGDTAFTLRPGTTIWLTMPGLSSLEAEVAWQRGAEFGAKFRTPLYPAVFHHIVSLSRSTP